MEENQNQPINDQHAPGTSDAKIVSDSSINDVNEARAIPTEQPSKKPWKLIVIILVVIMALGGAAALAYRHYAQKTSTKSNSAGAQLLRDRAFLRYAPDAAYEKDANGKVKTTTQADGSIVNVRKKTFNVTVEKNSVQYPIDLDDKVSDFGATTDNTFYALSCEAPKVEAVGGDNASFTVQFYAQDGKKLKQSTWRQQDTLRPDSLGDYCNANYFHINSKRVDFTPRGYGREAVDSLNYKVVYIKSDGSKQDVDTETAKDIDFPLGASPNKQFFLYDRVSAKQTIDGCGGSISIPYKVVDFSGPINELHVVDLTTNKDAMVGTEASFGVTNHEINLSSPGYFSSDSGRYYLREGGHGGCRGGGSFPIRIAYIDLKTNKLETVASPSGKQYSGYCFTDDGKYALENGAVDDYNDATPAVAPSPPTILDTLDSTTYQSDKLTTAFDCSADWLPHTFTALNKTTQPDKVDPKYTRDKTLLGITSFDPATRGSKTVTFKSPINISYISIDTIAETSTAGTSYINRSVSGAPTNRPTILFNNSSGATLEVPYASIVL